MGRLAATGLGAWNLHPAARPLKQLDSRETDAGAKKIDQAGDQEGDLGMRMGGSGLGHRRSMRINRIKGKYRAAFPASSQPAPGGWGRNLGNKMK